MPEGNAKRAVEPVPSALPEEPAKPAKVDTVPSAEIARMVWL